MNTYTIGELYGITIYLDKDVERGVLVPDDNEKWAYKVHPLTWEAIKKKFEAAPTVIKKEEISNADQ